SVITCGPGGRNPPRPARFPSLDPRCCGSRQAAYPRRGKISSEGGRKVGPMIDLERIRCDTPGATSRRAYLHNAGAALMPKPVLDTIKRHLDLEARIGGYAAAAREAERHRRVYASVAKLLNARPEEIAITENATVAWQMAFYSLNFKPG